jgi:hypothetical protein
MRVLSPRFFVAIAVAGLSGRVAAQSTPAPTAAKLQLAKRCVDDGIKAQDDGKYDEAIADYDKAYQLVSNALLLFNKAQAYRLAGKIDLAIEFYTRYLAEDPKGLKAQDARELLAGLQANSSSPAQPSRAQDAPATAPPDGAAAPAARSPEPGPSGPPGLITAEESTEPDSPSPGQNLHWAGIATMEVGAASLAVAASFGIYGWWRTDGVSKQFNEKDDNAGRRANTIAITGLIAGSGLVAIGGALWWWAGHRASGTVRVSVVPTVSDHLVGFAVSGGL